MRSRDGARLRVVHNTTFTYASPGARASYNEVRKLPVTTRRQTALEAKVRTVPHASQYAYTDYWGTQVVAFNVDAPHTTLVIESSSIVDTYGATEMPDAEWDALRGASDRFAELLAPTDYTEPDEALCAAALSLRRLTPLETAHELFAFTHRSLEYQQGSTHVRTSAAEAYAAGMGVCQDFAHLAVALLRVSGIPARYVSGYLHPEKEPQLGAEVLGESHAWVECFTGEWWGFDPTNGIAMGPRHVEVARGRDYADVAPVKGVYAGDAEHASTASVTLVRTA